MWWFEASHRRAAPKGQTFISCTAPCQEVPPTNRTPLHVRGTRRFPIHVSSDESLNCGDASCLTRCHRGFVSNSCHFLDARASPTPTNAMEVMERGCTGAPLCHVTTG